MNIHECHSRYDIGFKKLRRMHRDGVLKIDNTPSHWQRLISDIQKGKMSVRSIALAYKFPKKLENLTILTGRDRKIVQEHFERAGLPCEVDPDDWFYWVVSGAADANPRPFEQFMSDLKRFIPEFPVPYAYVAIRFYLPCIDEEDILDIDAKIRKAFTNAKKMNLMKGWWHLEPSVGTVFHRPNMVFDL